MKNPGICQRINGAADPTTITLALMEAKAFEWASDRTRRRWERLAERKIKQLEGAPKAT